MNLFLLKLTLISFYQFCKLTTNQVRYDILDKTYIVRVDDGFYTYEIMFLNLLLQSSQ